MNHVQQSWTRERTAAVKTHKPDTFIDTHDCQEDDSDEDDTTECGAGNNQQLHECLGELVMTFLHFFIDTIHQSRFGEFLQKTRLYTHTTESVTAFDANCRVVFPATFLMINVVYWSLYTIIL